MITEDYVSFKIAKLLKEKGFDGQCKMKYNQEGTMLHHIPGPVDLMLFTTDKKEIERHSMKNHIEYFLCPTHQMTIKWLREVHGVFISICNGNHKADNRDTSTPDNVYYFFVITDARAVYEEEKQCLKEFSSYEEACEAAIKYCLKNLI